MVNNRRVLNVMINQKIDGSMEQISQFFERIQIRLYVVIFVLVDRLLADTDRIRYVLLGKAILLAKELEFGQHKKPSPFDPFYQHSCKDGKAYC